jgi:hypothetical protein
MSPGFVEWLHGQPAIAIWLTFVAMNLSIFLALPMAVRWILKIELHEDLVKGADDAFKILTGLTMAVIAFSLVQVEGLHRNVGDMVSREGAILQKFNRTIDDFAGDQATAVRTPLQAYVASVIQSEWPAMAEGRRSPDTTAKLAALRDAIDQVAGDESIPADLAGEIKGQLIQLMDVREARLSSSHMGLSPYFWWGILLAMLLLAMLGWFQAPIQKAIPYLSGIAIGLSTLLSLLVVSAGIFEGEGRVSPEAIERAQALINASPGSARPTPSPSPSTDG